MKTTARKSNKKPAFTIIELLTVMSIIVILIGLLVPALNRVRNYAKVVRQNAQFHAIDVALEQFRAEHDYFPPSSRFGRDGEEYCGAMKLTEAMMGQDLLGFNPQTQWAQDLENASGEELYPEDLDPTDPDDEKNLQLREGPYLQLENANAYRLKHIYGVGETGRFSGDAEEIFVLCDVFGNVEIKDDPGTNEDNNIRGNTGMPILYYRAEKSANFHPENAGEISDRGAGIAQKYYHQDNMDLVDLGIPFGMQGDHTMDPDDSAPDGPITFYEMIRNKNITTAVRPHRPDSYILQSAGDDGEYGTADDIFNFSR